MSPDSTHVDIEGFREAVSTSARGSMTIVRNQGRPQDAGRLASWIGAVLTGSGMSSSVIDLTAEGAIRTHLGGVVQDIAAMHATDVVVLHGMDDAWISSSSGQALGRQLVELTREDSAKRIVLVRTDEDLTPLLVDEARPTRETTIAMERRLTAPLVHLMREISGCGMMDCKAAAEEAIARYDADFVLAVGILNAKAYAVMIRSRDPDVTDAEARRRWNVADAMGRRRHFAESTDAGRRLDELSGRYRGD